MKILVNGLIIDKHKAGIGQYSSNVIKNLLDREENEYSVIMQKSVSEHNSKIISVNDFKNSRERIFFEQFILPSKYSKKFDLIHYLDYSSPYINMKTPFITTIHDLSFYKYPETFSYGSMKIKQILTPKSIKRADKIIAVSESTKRDIVRLFPEADEKIRVIYQAVTGFNRVENRNEVKQVTSKYGITGQYILGVGTIEPRKNLKSLIKAFKQVHKKFKDIKLVLVGKKGWLYDEFFSQLDKDDLKDNIIYTGYVEQEDLKYIYSGAECFIYPSLYEGFGLPPLEAMSCGVPVIVSNSSSLPEVVGKAGILVNPLDIDEITQSIINVLSNINLKNKLIDAGLEQSKQFNWNNSIEKIVDVYNEILR